MEYPNGMYRSVPGKMWKVSQDLCGLDTCLGKLYSADSEQGGNGSPGAEVVSDHGQVFGRLICQWSAEKMDCRGARTLARRIYRDSSSGSKEKNKCMLQIWQLMQWEVTEKSSQWWHWTLTTDWEPAGTIKDGRWPTGVSWGRGTVNSVLDILSQECQWDIQAEISASG